MSSALVFFALFSAICVVPTSVSAIFRGVPASINDHPYQASVQYRERHKCGGSIVSPNFVITAAQCVKAIPLRFLRVHTGFFSLDRTHNYNVDQVLIHPNFTMTEFTIPSFDVALIRLEKAIDDTSKPIKMFKDREEIEPGFLANVTGWTSKLTVQLEIELQAANTTIVDNKTCDYVYASLNGITDSHICAGWWGTVEGLSGPCMHDEGDPLIVDGRLAGLVTMYSCGRPFQPDVFTKIARVRKWIDQYVQN